jgi:hypothetical protein
MKLSNSQILRPKLLLLSVSFLILIFFVLSISFILGMNFPQSKRDYVIAQTIILRTTELDVNFDKLVEAGSDQSIRLTVKDVRSGDPISSATARITIYFPGGEPMRQFLLPTNDGGMASLTLPVDNKAALGQYGIDVIVSKLGYFDSSVGTIFFAVNSEVDQNVSLDDYTHTIHTISGQGD